MGLLVVLRGLAARGRAAEGGAVRRGGCLVVKADGGLLVVVG